MIHLAILSPSTTNNVETFVRSHINGIGANVFFYYGDFVPRYCEGSGAFSIDKASLKHPFYIAQRILSINPIKYKSSGLNIFEYLFVKSLKRNKIDVVLAEYGTTSANVVKSCKYAGIPLIAHFHGRDSSAYDVIKEYKIKYADLFNYASAIIVVSHDMANRLISIGCSKDKIIYAPCAPDDNFSKLRSKLNSKQFLSIGRFVDKKAPYLTLSAFKSVCKLHPDATLIMAGNGPLLQCCKNLSKVFGIERQVSFPGAITPNQAQEYMLRSLAYVQHSIRADDGDMEGTPVSIMEASAAGLPVIATRHAGIPDIVKDNETGLLCKELDIDKMANDMNLLLNDHQLAVKLGTSGKEYMSSHFSKKEQMKILTQVVETAYQTYHNHEQ